MFVLVFSWRYVLPSVSHGWGGAAAIYLYALIGWPLQSYSDLKASFTSHLIHKTKCKNMQMINFWNMYRLKWLNESLRCVNQALIDLYEDNMPWFHVLETFRTDLVQLNPSYGRDNTYIYRGLHLASIDHCLNYPSFWLEHAHKLLHFSKLAVGVYGGWRMREKRGFLLCQLSIVIVIPPPLPVPPRVHREV